MHHKANFPQVMREAGFKLRQYKDGPLDWRLMASYETDRILWEQNLEVVDDALKHLSEAPLGTVLDSHVLDGGIAKYFVMSQYAIQYLLCCRTYLDESVGELREAHEVAQEEIAKLRKLLSESNNEVVQLHKKITQIETIREVVYPCHLCTKNFISNEALNVHIGRKHRMGTPTSTTGQGSAREKENDAQLINAIKMELEIKHLKERLNVAERNIKERSRTDSPRQDKAIATITTRNVGVQIEVNDYEYKDELSSEAAESEAIERKQQLHGLAERLSSFEVWQAQMKESNEEFIMCVNKKLEDLTLTLEQTKQRAANNNANGTAGNSEKRVASPSLDELERILTEKMTEIGKASADKLEEVVQHLEIGYKEKLEALERDLKQLSSRNKASVVVDQPHATKSKIPKHQPKREESIERIKRMVEDEFLKSKRDEETFSTEESAPEQEQKLPVVTHVQELPSGNSSGSHPTYTKQAAEPTKVESKTVKSSPDVQETTDMSESLSMEESFSDEESELITSEPERRVFNSPKMQSLQKAITYQKPKKPMTRKDAQKLVNQKLKCHGFNMNSKCISNTSAKRLSAELAQQRASLKLDHPNFYTTRNRIRKFVDKLCSARLPDHAHVLLKNKTPLQPMEVPTRRAALLTTTDDDDGDNKNSEKTSASEELRDEDRPTFTSKSQQQQNFKAKLEHLLAKPAAHVNSNPKQGGLNQARPVPLPRKRVMFNTHSSKSINTQYD